MDQQQPTPPPAPLSPPVAALLAALAPVLAQAPAELAGPVALADLRAPLAAGDALRAAVLGRISDVDTYPLCDLSHDHLHVRGLTLTLRDGTRLHPDGATRPDERHAAA